MPPQQQAKPAPASLEFTKEDYEAAAPLLYPEYSGHKFNGSEIVCQNAKKQTVYIHQDILARQMSDPAVIRKFEKSKQAE